MFSMKCLLLVAFVTILIVQASPGKVKHGGHGGPKDPSVTGHPHHDRPTLAPGETRPPHGKHHSHDDDHTHDPLHDKGPRPLGRKSWGFHDGKSDSHDGDFTKEHHGEKPTLAPGQTFPPRRPPHGGKPGRRH